MSWCVRCIRYGDRAYATADTELCEECLADDEEFWAWNDSRP